MNFGGLVLNAGPSPTTEESSVDAEEYSATDKESLTDELEGRAKE